MSKIMVYDVETHAPLGEKDIPDDVIDAAAKVAEWLRAQPISMELHGLGVDGRLRELSQVTEIPDAHWEALRASHTTALQHAYMVETHWKPQLLGYVQRQPDPAERFADWLSAQATGEKSYSGLHIVFFEQPYLTWAENVKRAMDRAEKEMRKQIAAEVEYGPGD